MPVATVFTKNYLSKELVGAAGGTVWRHRSSSINQSDHCNSPSATSIELIDIQDVVRLHRMGLPNFSSSLDTSKAESEPRERNGFENLPSLPHSPPRIPCTLPFLWASFKSMTCYHFLKINIVSHLVQIKNQLFRIVALTGTALDSGERLARAGDQISSSFSQLAPGFF